MSKILSLSVHQFRNIESASLELGPGLNLIVGDNAAGKTALIEALWVLSTGRSFRTSKPQNCIQIDSSGFTLFTQSQLNDQTFKIGINRTADALKMKVDGQLIKVQSELAAKLPLQLLTPESHRLLEEGPKARRQYIDWGCFHQVPSFIHHWKQYQRVLKQRNQALRQKLPVTQITLWDAQLVASAEAMNEIRQSYVMQLQPLLLNFCQLLMPELMAQAECHFRSGWPKTTANLQAALLDSLQKDLQLGHTQYGAHRADLQFKFNGKDALHILSRGQQKLFVCALLLAQASLYEQVLQSPVIMLVDDLPAELDEKHRATLLSLLNHLNIQHILTSTAQNLIPILDPATAKIWHIQQGKMSALHKV